ncbi:chemotaxis protein methyltransferase [Aureimonas endophytica]|uniref:Chemotaxis protein methyltransferase n=1 Tax=Aureimonas endophytica TaxID=2027858 RepID=A0A917A4D8_9HYPH|nr:CheR family methyltransferase [Aureimonas endophytica]GGE25309.1 chemotaxis protein methyltransferase [Aureimonas endophytica]
MPTATAKAAPSPAPAAGWSNATLDADSFRSLALLVGESCGIVMSDLKRTMLETRLRRRLVANGLDSFRAYAALLRTPEGLERERQAFIDCVVTNQTSFFREPPHFEHLTVEELRRLAAGGREHGLRLWSAASSSGQEAYSLAMIADRASEGGRLFPFSVLATDISLRMLRAVREGVYAAEEAETIPAPLRQRHLLPAPDGKGGFQIHADLRRHLRLGQINLMHEQYMPGQVMDVIFCRNVLIYFKPEDQLAVVGKLCRHLRPGGLLFLGHSESLRSAELPLRLLGCNIYERLEG